MASKDQHEACLIYLGIVESRNWASSKSDSKDILVDSPAGNWADHMELVEGLAELEPEPLREH